MPSDNNKSNISAGKPKIGGAIYRAASGTTLPTNATATLSTAFTCVGYISDAGVTHSINLDTTEIKEWGGGVVYVAENSRTENYQFAMIEATNAEVQKIIYGDSAVTGTVDAGMTVVASAAPLGEHVYVIEEELAGSVKHRTVIPAGIVSAIGDVVNVSNDVIKYPVTITAMEDSNEKMHYDYYSKVTSGT